MATNNTKMPRHVIDCDADPFVPTGSTVEKHIKDGQFEWDPTKIVFYLSENQQNGHQNGKWIRGYKLRKDLKDKPVMNANVLDYLLAHQELILELKKFMEKVPFVCFWGTIYRDSGGYLYVRYLCGSSESYWEWSWRAWELVFEFHGGAFAAMYESNYFMQREKQIRDINKLTLP